MKVTATMIEAFFRDELDDYRKELVKDYFRSNPEALQSYLTEEGWEDFNTKETLSAPIADKMLQVIEAGTYKKQSIRSLYYRWASVAAVLFILVAGFLLLIKKKATPERAIGVIPSARPLVASQEWKSTTNPTEKVMKLSLKDGSEVELSAGAGLRYRENFTPDKRDLYLAGSALFKVGRDPLRPFTVYADGLGITALGTVFRILSPLTGSKKMEVRLLSGKVVVRPDSLLRRKGIKAVYLEPGQSFLLDREKFTVSVIRRAEKGGLIPPGTELPATAKVYAFDNRLLTDIFKELEADYRVKFNYKPDQLKDMTFTGKFNNQKETLDNFLQTIATLNGLRIGHENSGVYIIQ